ncbi:MAG: delta-60 repeat domain-containing protein [Flavobacteriales bacterium]|nr:delta-60 repeat domain-containing protein [Flavobacteriales bacterium]
MAAMHLCLHGQAGSNDVSFNTADKGYANHGTGNVHDMAQQPDDKIVIVGSLGSYNGVTREYIARVNSDGTLDSSFAPVQIANAYAPTAVALQSDGKILVGADNYRGLVRLNTDGTTDASFPTGVLVNFQPNAGGSVHDVVVQSDGRILVGGFFSYYNFGACNSLIRLLPDGTRDPTFTAAIGCYGVMEIEVQPDGRIIIVGYFTTYGGVARMGVARLEQDGTLDTTFDAGSGGNGLVSCIRLQEDGRILLGGDFTSFNGVPCERIVRLDHSGNVEPTFFTIPGANGAIKDIAIDDVGSILCVGEFTMFGGAQRGRIGRLRADGTLDQTFNDQIGSNNTLNCVLSRSDGTVVIGGAQFRYGSLVRRGLTRLLHNGSADEDFNPTVSANSSVASVLLTSGGKVLIAGGFTAYGGVARTRIARLMPNGELDRTFDPGSGPDHGVWKAAMQVDGRVLIAGEFTNYGGTPCNGLARILETGSIDTTYRIGTGAAGQVVCVAVGPDDKALVGGLFQSFNGLVRKRLVRLGSDGSVDVTFDPGSGPNSTPWDFAWQQDGRIIMVGGFTSYDGTPCGRIVRLFPDGRLDRSFSTGLGADDRIMSVAVRHDGTIFIGGYFRNFNGVPYCGIMRLHPNGEPDLSFDVGSGVGGNVPGSARVYSIIPQPWDNVIIAGEFTTFDGFQANRIARLRNDGSLDDSFRSAAGANGMISSVALQADGRILLGGSFTSYDGAPRSYVARANGDRVPGIHSPLLLYPNPISASGDLSIEWAQGYLPSNGEKLHLVVTDMTGRIERTLDLANEVTWRSLNAPATPGCYHIGLWLGPELRIGGRFIVE